MDLQYRHGLMVQTRTHGIDIGSWYRHQLMVSTKAMLLTQTPGIVLVLLNHTRTRGPNVTRMQNFFLHMTHFFTQSLIVRIVAYSMSGLEKVHYFKQPYRRERGGVGLVLVYKEEAKTWWKLSKNLHRKIEVPNVCNYCIPELAPLTLTIHLFPIGTNV